MNLPVPAVCHGLTPLRGYDPQPLRELQKLPNWEINVSADSRVEQVRSRQLKPALLLVIHRRLEPRLQNW